MLIYKKNMQDALRGFIIHLLCLNLVFTLKCLKIDLSEPNSAAAKHQTDSNKQYSESQHVIVSDGTSEVLGSYCMLKTDRI